MIRLLAASFVVAASLAAAPLGTKAQTLEAVEAAEAAVVESWLRTPLMFRTAVIVEADPGGFGVYTERESTAFPKGEPVVAYAEPLGYAWRENGDGTYTFGFDVDLILKRPDGSIVAGQENFQHLELTSRAKNREFMLKLTLTVDGAPAGDYIIEYRARDIASDKEGTISLPFSIVD